MFDEYHFAAFVDQYITGNYLFDIHPPLGKLTLTAVAKLSGYKSLNFSFDALGKPYPKDFVYIPQRAFAALAGSFIPSVLYMTCRTLSMSTAVSITTACMALFDMLLCVESRLILTDSQLILFIQGSLLCALKMWQTPKSTPKRYYWVFMTALVGACAVSTKWTAIVTPGLIAIISLTGAVFPSEGMLDLLEMAAAGVVAIAFYVATFWIHFKMLPKSGPGDAFMKVEFQRTLLGSQHFVPNNPKPPGFIENFRYLNWEMLRANSAIEERHPWESKWYEWLYNAKGVLYLDDPAPGGQKEQIYVLMNPVLPIVSGIGVIAGVLLLVGTPLAIRFARRKPESEEAVRKLKKRAGTILFFLVGWVLNLLPYIGIKRCTFLYHVLPALQMACLLTAVMLEQLPKRGKIKELVCVLIVVSMGTAFYHWRAWTYGLHRTPEELKKLRLMPRWD